MGLDKTKNAIKLGRGSADVRGPLEWGHSRLLARRQVGVSGSDGRTVRLCDRSKATRAGSIQSLSCQIARLHRLYLYQTIR